MRSTRKVRGISVIVFFVISAGGFSKRVAAQEAPLQTAYPPVASYNPSELSVAQMSAGPDTSLNGDGLSLHSKFCPRWALGGVIKKVHQAFLDGLAASAYYLNLVSTPASRSMSSYALYQKGDLTVGATGGRGVAVPEGASSDRGYWKTEYSGRLYVQHLLSSWMKVETGAQGRRLMEDPSLADQSQTDIGFYLKVHFPIDGLYR